MPHYPIILIIVIITGAMVTAYRIQRKKARKRNIETIDRISSEVDSAFAEISSYYNYSHYITESERKNIETKYKPLFQEVKDVISSKELKESAQKELFTRFYKAMSDTKAHKNSNNKHFIANELSRCSEYFDKVLAYPLDEQQRKAIVSLEDNVLVISSAGSGKTMTTVGKVRYLIDIQKVSPEKILLITFTRKAAESLSDRLGEKSLKCRTFHKLALEIISDATGVKPTFTANDFPMQVYQRLFNGNYRFRTAVTDYILRARYKMRDQFQYSSVQEYMQDRQKYGIQAYFKDMDGRPVFCKSDEESQICDFLGSRGVKFRYEEKYEYTTADADHRQYCPDFSIYIDKAGGHSERIYLEHFAVNESGRCPSWFSQEDEQKYIDSITWKRQLHKEKGTTLLETSSAEFHRGDVFDILSNQLKQHGVIFSAPCTQNLSRELAHQEENILSMLSSFNFLFKSQDVSLESIQRKADKGQDRITLNEIVIPFINAYQQVEKERGEIDFTDAIIQATELCNNGHAQRYEYILVDEFQDISKDRYRFLQSLRQKNPLTKLFCVGDDWQSIYRFAGSDMALFKHFEDYFGYTKKCLMETTYRFGEPAIKESSKFILANPEQEHKNVHSFMPDAETIIDFIPTDSRTDIAETVMRIADQIPRDKEILLLGRYSFDINVLKNTGLSVTQTKQQAAVNYRQRRMTFMTVHQSKGLECDYIILLNCNGGTMGFPADIADSPVLKYVLSEPDAYAFSEERRVFYVGITRAKKHTWVLYDKNNPSPFVKEFVCTPKTKSQNTNEIPKSERCPKCNCGRIITIKRGIAVNGNPYSFLACSNEKYGCNYHETVFVNLNARRKRQTRNTRPRKN